MIIIKIYINILSNHPPNIIKNLPSNIFKRTNNLSVDEATFNESKDLYNNTLAESGFKHKVTAVPRKTAVYNIKNNISKVLEKSQ